MPSVTAYATEGESVIETSTEDLDDANSLESSDEGIEGVLSEPDDITTEEQSSDDAEVGEDLSFASDEEVVEKENELDEAVLEDKITENQTFDEGQLPIATDLKWTEDGHISFVMPSTDYYYNIILERPNDSPSIYMGYSCKEPGHLFTFSVCNNYFDGGLYKVKVKTTDRLGDTSLGGAVTNAVERNYVRPQNVYKTPTKLWWSADGTVNWNAVSNDASYYISHYQDGQKKVGTYTSGTSYKLYNAPERFSEGNWTFTIITYGEHPGEIASSPESDMSPVFDGTDQGPEALPLVTNATWNGAGHFSFNCPRADLYYTLFIKKPDGSIFRHAGIKVESDGTSFRYSCSEHFLGDGTYSFAVKTTESSGDYDSTSGSVIDWVTLNYTRPNNAYATPNNPHWLADGTAEWDAVPGNPYYYVYFYKDSKIAFSRQYVKETSLKADNLDLSSGSWTFTVMAYGSNPDQTAASDFSKESPVYGAVSITGLADAGDGNWYLYKDGEIQTSYNGLYNDAKCGWWLVLDGKVAFDYNDLYYDANCGWWKIVNGTVDFEYTDLYDSPSCGWWKIYGGSVDFGYSDLYDSPSCGWWMINGGAVDFGYSDLYNSPSCGWWKIYGGAVDFGYSDLYNSPSCGWWKINGGTVDFGYNDLYDSPSCGWWKVNGGSVDFGYSDIFKSSVCGNWKVEGGFVDFAYTGWYDSQRYGLCYVKDGFATFDRNDL